MTKPVKLWPKIKKENAQTMVEFALVFPLVLLITYGLIEFGRMLYIYAAITNASREGARYGAAGGNFNARKYMDCSGILAAVHRNTVLAPINNSDISIWYDHGPNTNHILNSCPPIDANGADMINMGDRIGVHVIGHYEPLIAFTGLHGFDIISENARTILVDVGIIGTSLPPIPTNTPVTPPPPTLPPPPTPEPSDTPPPTETPGPGTPSATPETPTITPTPMCVVDGGDFEFNPNTPNTIRWTLTSLSNGPVRMIYAGITWPDPNLAPNMNPPASEYLNTFFEPMTLNILSNQTQPTIIVLATKPPDTATPTPTETSTPTITPTPTETPIPPIYLNEIDVGANMIWLGLVHPPSAYITSWLGGGYLREVTPGGQQTYNFIFNDLLQTGDYSVTLIYLDLDSGTTCSESFSATYTEP